MPEVLDQLVGFARELRRCGIAASTAQLVALCRAADACEPSDVYWVGRVSLLTDVEQISAYDDAFRRYWGRLDVDTDGDPARPPADRDTAGTESTLGARGAERGRDTVAPSRLELLREKSFADIEDDELDAIAWQLRALLRRLPTRPSRRMHPARSGELDLRRTAARTLRHAGDSHERTWRRHGVRERRLVLLLDMSGSMSRYSRALLLLGHASAATARSCEVFCFSTRLTRVTHLLRDASPAEAITRAAAAAADWDGGTRIGGSLKAFLDQHGHAGMARGAVVVIVSDGLEADEPELLGGQMARLARLAHRVIWLNPLKAQSSYEPLAQGMAAALPHVDAFASGHSLATLEPAFAAGGTR